MNFSLMKHACSILSLPLIHHCTKDKLIWAATKNGIYSTKSAYQLLHDTAKTAASGPSNQNAHKKYGRVYGHLMFQARFDISFGWLVMIPFRQNRINKRIPSPNALCEHCCSEIEDSAHALWGCQMLREIWWEVESCRILLQHISM